MVPSQEMMEKSLSLNLISYSTIIEALARGHMVDKVIYIFSKTVKNECCPNEFTYSVILNLLVLEGQLGQLDEVIEMSKKFLNKSIYACLVRTLSKLDHAGEAHRLSCNMWIYLDQGDRDAYMSMLESLCSSGKTTEALELLQNIHEKGVDPNTMMYNMVFSALKKSKQISQLHDLYVKMKLDGPSPDIFTYSILISSFGRVGKVDKTVKVFKELEESNCNPDVISYNSLINCLGNFDQKKKLPGEEW